MFVGVSISKVYLPKKPSIYCSSIVKSRSNPFLEPTSTKQ